MAKQRICIVDDQPIIIEALTTILEKSENVEIAGTFLSAELYMAEYERLQPDVTVMDLNLPGMSGIEAIILIKSKYPEAIFLVLTNYNDDEHLFNALKAGASGYLLKKNSLETMEGSIISMLDGGAPMTPEIAKKLIVYFQRNNNYNTEKKYFDVLTDKEIMVLGLLADGFLYKEISDKLLLSIDVIKKMIQQIYNKLQVKTRSEAIKKYFTS